MAYTELRKLYYGDKAEYQKVYHQRFTSENATRLDFDIDGLQAFYVQSSDVIDQMYRILQLDKEIYMLSRRLPKIALTQYSKRCLIDEIVITNNIEGVHSSRKEIGAALNILEEQSSQKGKKNVFLGLVNRYMRLLDPQPVSLQTCQDIRTIYDEIVLEEVLREDRHNVPDGQIFRKEMTEVYGPTGKSLHKGKYPESAIITYMEKALQFLNNQKINPLYRICIFHYLLEYIHPFYDGNGRLGRFILSYWISVHLEHLIAFRISETIKEHIKEYYKAFTVCNSPRNLGDLTPFLIMMLNMIADASEDLKDSLRNKLDSWGRYVKEISCLEQHENGEMHNLYDVLIQAALFSERGISTQELLTFFDTNYTTIKKRLDIIAAQNLLIVEKQGNRKYYQLNLDTLSEIGAAL